ncbi:hypothetical protein [Enterobacter cloacae]|uniref:hypothetical protein n=1 Tax=Enterobacter cloacae TaxID=550 RepID=UPI003510172E
MLFVIHFSSLRRLSYDDSVRTFFFLSQRFLQQLIAHDATPSSIPDSWQDTFAPVHYAQALPQAILGNILPQEVNIALRGLLHDRVYLLADYVKEPYLPS